MKVTIPPFPMCFTLLSPRPIFCQCAVSCWKAILWFSSLKVDHVSCLSQDETLHKALGPVSYSQIRKKLGMQVKKQSVCEACAISKISQRPFNKKHSRAERPFQELHCDFVGPINPLKSKSEVATTLQFLIITESKIFNYTPMILHSDRGTFLTLTLLNETG